MAVKGAHRARRLAFRWLWLAAVAGCSGAPSGSSTDETSGTTAGTGSGTSGTTDDSGPTAGTGESETGGSETGWTTGSTDQPWEPAQCDSWDPDCPDGEKCTAYAKEGTQFDANGCFPIMGDGMPGDPCMAFGVEPGFSGLDDCGAGSICWQVDVDTSIGLCVPFCGGTASQPVCPPAALCNICGNCVVTVCLAECDPLAPGVECPSPNDLCVPHWKEGFFCRPNAGENVGYGGGCQGHTWCAPGLFCADAAAVPGCQGGQGCCSPYCDVTLPNDCPGKAEGQQCVPWYEPGMAPEGQEDVGGCAIPN